MYWRSGIRSLAALTGAVLCASLACNTKDFFKPFDEGALPSYPRPSTTLRLVPESATIGPEGGTLFVDVELHSEGAVPSSVIFIAGHGATVSPVPGPTLCEAMTTSSPNGGADGGARQTSDSGVLRIPSSATFADAPDASRRTGILVTVPAGDIDATIDAAAYQQRPDDSASCDVEQNGLIGVGFLRIPRTKPPEDAGTADQAVVDPNGGDDADQSDAAEDSMEPDDDAGNADAGSRD